MNLAPVVIESADAQKLLGAASSDAALLYIFLKSGNAPQEAAGELNMNEARLGCALATLQQLGLWQEVQKQPLLGQRPVYTEQDVLRAMGTEQSFHALYGEVQRRLGRTLTTEELKILLGFIRYLGLPEDVICVLIGYCQERARRKGSLRNPSLRTIEKEAYAWAEQGIDTMEAAAAFIHRQEVYHSRLGKLLRLLQIRGRNLTPAEEKYAASWLDMGLSEELISMAYERTCLNTGGLSWAYMHKILSRWKDAGYTKPEDVRAGDKKAVPKGASGTLGAAERAAIERAMREDK